MRRGPNALGTPMREARISGAMESTQRGEEGRSGRGMAHLAADAVADAVVLLVGVAAGLGHRGGEEEPATRARQGTGNWKQFPSNSKAAAHGAGAPPMARGPTETRALGPPESTERSPAGSCAAARGAPTPLRSGGWLGGSRPRGL